MRTLTIDLETTGIPPKGADYKVDFMQYPRILSIGFKFDENETIERIINQGSYRIPEEITAINGITQEMVDASPYQLEGVLIEEILTLDRQDFIIGHNIYFDTSIIKANILRLIQENRITQAVYDAYEELLHKDKRIDTMRLGQKVTGGKWPKLIELYTKLFPTEDFQAHRAGNDVDACYRCYVELDRLGIVPKPAPAVVEEEI